MTVGEDTRPWFIRKMSLWYFLFTTKRCTPCDGRGWLGTADDLSDFRACPWCGGGGRLPRKEASR